MARHASIESVVEETARDINDALDKSNVILGNGETFDIQHIGEVVADNVNAVESQLDKDTIEVPFTIVNTST